MSKRPRFAFGNVLETKTVPRAGLIPRRVSVYRGIFIDDSTAGETLRVIRAKANKRECVRRLECLKVKNENTNTGRQ